MALYGGAKGLQINAAYYFVRLPIVSNETMATKLQGVRLA